MSKMSVLLVLVGLMSSAMAHLNLHGEPLLSGLTSFTMTVTTATVTKPTTCFITSGEVTQCRRKRGMEEKPIYYDDDNLKIEPSSVWGIETTPIPRAFNPQAIFNAYKIYSSIDDSYRKSQNIFRQVAVKGRNNNVITVGNCGMSTVNIMEFFSCLGMTLQETTTLTATYTKTSVFSSGYTTMTVAGCTPAGFPYFYCPATADSTAVTSSTAATSSAAVTPSTPVITTTAATSSTAENTSTSESTTITAATSSEFPATTETETEPTPP